MVSWFHLQCFHTNSCGRKREEKNLGERLGRIVSSESGLTSRSWKYLLDTSLKIFWLLKKGRSFSQNNTVHVLVFKQSRNTDAILPLHAATWNITESSHMLLTYHVRDPQQKVLAADKWGRGRRKIDKFSYESIYWNF